VRKIVECVPNFSEGRRKHVVDEIAAALTSPPGVALLDSEMDAAHNRCVITIAGEPDAVAAGVESGVGVALQRIDLREHRGEHPRMGAADVIPFVPISEIGMEECVALSARVAENLSRRYALPTYLYEQSARIPERQDLAWIRKGEFETIRDEIGRVPGRKPDFGPAEVHPSGGVTAVGARFPLIAYNVYLATADVKIAQAIAKAVRFSSGGLRYVKALGFEIKERGQVQVSMNLTNYEATPVFRVFEMVEREAQRYGVPVVSSEIVGLVPQKALDACGDYYLRLEGFSPRQVLENRLSESLEQAPTGTGDFVAKVAAPDPAPGGGSVAAMAGSLAAALGEMVSGLTVGRKKYEAVQDRVREIQAALSKTRKELDALVQEDADAYGAVMAALKMSKETPEQKAARSEALEAATRRATEVPLRTVRLASSLLPHIETLIQIGNTNARSDAAAGAQLAFAALKAGQYNVLINIGGLKDKAFAEASRVEAARLASEGQTILARIDGAMNG
jgi:glutamate formiminotransferase / formiminotetrahydrofolate cyclodeaminase